MRRAQAVAVRRRPVRTVTAQLEAEGYEGSSVEMRSNAELRTLDQLNDLEDVAAVRRAVASLIVGHNLVDDRGQDLVLDESASQLTNEELWMIVAAYYKALHARTELPKDAAAS